MLANFNLMNKLIFVGLLGLFGTQGALAQHDEKPSPRHEVGLNTGPVLVALLGGNQNPQALGLYYKRLIKGGALRVQLTNASPFMGWSSDFQSYPFVFSAIDSSLINRQSVARNRGGVLWLGREFRVPKRNGWTFTYGFDLGLTYGLSNLRMQDWRYSGAYVDSMDNRINYNIGKWEGITDVSLRQTQSFGVGSRVTVGALKELSPRLFLHVQSGFSAFVQQSRSSFTNYQNNTLANFNSQSFTLNSGPFIHELGLYYRF